MLKNFYFKILLLSFLNVVAVGAMAQVNENYALTAKEDAFTNDPNGLWNWPQINNNTILGCGSQEAFIWTSSGNYLGTAYMEWTWTKPLVIDSIVVHHAVATSRFLTGGTVQKWDGAKWVDHEKVTFSFGNCVNSAKLSTPVAGDRIRIAKLEMSGTGQTSNPNFREILIFGPATDVEIDTAVMSQTTFCSGNGIPLTTTFTNHGPAELTELKIQYGIKGNAMQSQVFKFSPSIKVNETKTVNLDPLITNGNGNLTVLVKNGYPDVNSKNDEFETPVTVLRAPSGSVLNEYPGSNFIYNTGDQGDPDITKEKDTVIYEFTPPFGYVNSGYGNTWSINPQPIAEKGYPIPSNFYQVFPPQGGDNGVIAMIVPSGMADSVINLNIKLNSAANGCDSTINRLIYVASTPRPDFIFENTCAGFPTIFTNQSSIDKGLMFYMWDFGDGFTTDQQEPFHTYTQPGTYKVKLTVTSDFGVKKDTTIDVTIGEQPDARFAHQNMCEGLDIDYVNNSTINNGTLTYTWDLGDGNTRTSKDVTYRYAQPGIYRVTLTAVSGEKCVGAFTRNVVQFARPTADFEVSGANTCGNEPIQFENTSTIEMNEKTGAHWFFGDGSDLTQSKVAIHKYATPGTRTVKMVAYSQFGCKDSIEKQIDIIAGPEVDFNWNRNCSESPVVFTNNTNEQGANVIYTWSFGDGNTTDDKNPSHVYGTLGKRLVKLYAEADNGCKQEMSKTIVILPEPRVDFEVQDVCAGDYTQFVNKSDVEFGDLDYTWEFGDGQQSIEQSPTYRYDQNGGATYDVTLKAKQPGSCEGQVTKSVQVFEKPECGFTAVQSTEDRRVYTLTPNNDTYKSYLWVVEGSGLTSTDVEPTFELPFAEKHYRVKLTITSDEDCNCNNQEDILTAWEVGVDQLINDEVAVYPNPANLTLNVKTTSTIQSIQLKDMSGKSLSATTNGSDMQKSIDLSMLANGMYLIEVTTENGVITKKINVQH